MKKQDKLNDVVASHLKLIAEDVVQFQGNQVYLGAELMSAQEIQSIAAECKLLKETKLWQVFQETIRYNALKVIVEANTTEEVLPGKWMIAVLNDLNIFLHNFITTGKQFQPLGKPDV